MSSVLEQIQQEIAKLEAGSTQRNVGRIVTLADGVAKLDGLSAVMYNEMIEFPGGVFGIALNLEEDEVGTIILGDYAHLKAVSYTHLCGHGHFLSAYAAAHPKTYCLGVDLVTQRIERANRKQTRLALQNLAFLKADVVETLASLPPYVQLAGIFVLFPDPWPKTRHQDVYKRQDYFRGVRRDCERPRRNFARN